MALNNLYDGLDTQITQNNKTKSTKQRFKYLVVLDFEATCARNTRINPQEIIEWPAMIIDTRTNKISDKIFHFYIRPKHKPKLTAFCTELTGITQQLLDKVGSRNTIESVTEQWNKWCYHNDLLPMSEHEPNACIVTCGDWDLKTMWTQQLKVSDCTAASLFYAWINIKHVFRQNTDYYTRQSNIYRQGGLNMMSMLSYLNIKHKGRHHSGIDDVRNICKIVQRLLKDGVSFDYTTKQFGKRRIWADIHIKSNFSRLEQKETKQKGDTTDVVDLTANVVDLTNNDDEMKKN
eukprot:465629_1